MRSSMHAASTTVADMSLNRSISTYCDTTWSGSSIVLKTQNAEVVESFVYTKLVPIVCTFGIAGNVLNLIVLSRKSLTYSMERMEKSAHCGLMALAISDLLFCIVTLPNSHYGVFRTGGGGSFIHDSFDFRLAYKLYGNAVVNMFILASTWLTVAMATSRYLAICHPLRARQFIGKRFSIASLVTVFVVCQLFNIPRLFRDEPRTIVRSDEVVVNGSSPAATVVYFVYPGPLRRHQYLERAYDWTYFVLGIIVPLLILIFCNAHLSAALRRSLRMRSDHVIGSARYSFRRSTVSSVGTSSAGKTQSPLCCRSSVRRGRGERAAMRLTLTLIIIVVMYVTLFVPAELFNFFAEHVVGSHDLGAIYNTSLAFGNLLQAVNFAVNFVLYCAVNTHFRQTICRLTGCNYTTSIRQSSLEANASISVLSPGLDATAQRSSSHLSARSHHRPSGEISKEHYKHIEMCSMMANSSVVNTKFTTGNSERNIKICALCSNTSA